MSKFKVIETVFTDIASLKKALSDLDIDFDIAENVKENSLSLFGYQSDERKEKCVIRISRKVWNEVADTGASNDLGFSFNSKTGLYEAIISDYDLGSSHARRKFDEIKKEYAFNSVTTTARKKGYTVRKVERDGGQITLQLAKI